MMKKWKRELWGSIPEVEPNSHVDEQLMNGIIIDSLTTAPSDDSDNSNDSDDTESSSSESDCDGSDDNDESSANEIISDKEMSQTEEESVDYDEFTIETQDSFRSEDLQLIGAAENCLILIATDRPNDDDLMCDKKILQAIKLADYCDQVMSGELKLLENDPVKNDEIFNSEDTDNVFQFIEKINMKRWNRLWAFNRIYTNEIELTRVEDISSETSWKLLKCSIATVFAFLGFSETTEDCLEVLTEVAEDYMKKVFRLLSVNVDKFSLDDKDYGFEDPIDRTCHEIGLDGVRDLLQFYEESVINRIKETCEKYQSINALQQSEIEDEPSIQIEDMDESMMEIPELHVPNDNLISNDTLRAGYQMLNKLENIETIDDEDYC